MHSPRVHLPYRLQALVESIKYGAFPDQTYLRCSDIVGSLQ